MPFIFPKALQDPDFMQALSAAKPTPTTKRAQTTTTTYSPQRSSNMATLFRPQTYEKDASKVDPLDPVAIGGQSTRKVIGSTLREAQRRSRITGRTLRPEVAKGLASSWFAQAPERLAVEKGLKLQERGQDIAVRGQDIQAGLGYAGIESGERKFAGQLKLEQGKIASAEKMFKDGLISQEQLTKLKLESAERMNKLQSETQLSTARMQAREQRYSSENTGGFFGGGGFLGLGCIIISACTSPTSYEVNIARQYRDKYMDVTTRAGYYGLSEVVVPFIHRYGPFKRFLKKWLVGSIVDHSECVLGHKSAPRSRVSAPIMINFLRLCRLIGFCMDSQEALDRVWAHL
jgi:hypothetical protein